MSRTCPLKMCYPQVGAAIQTRFSSLLANGAVPVRQLRRGTVVDRSIPKARAANTVTDGNMLPLLLVCNPNGDCSETERFNGQTPAGPGAWAYYGGIVKEANGVSPGMIAEVRHYNNQLMKNAPEIQPGQYVRSTLIGEKNPAYVFMDRMVIRARIRIDITVVDLDYSNPAVRQFNESFSNTIRAELNTLHKKDFFDALFDEEDYSVSRPIGNHILLQEKFAGLLATSARKHHIRPGPWQGQELNIILKAEKNVPNKYLEFASAYIASESEGKLHFASKRGDDVHAALQT